MGDFVIEAHGLHKTFKGHPALAGLDLQVPAGSIYGFLGRNGAGKTTTIKLLMGSLRLDAGHARVLGIPVGDRNAGIGMRRRVGLVTEEKDLYPYMTVGQIIRFTRSFFPRWREDLERRYLTLFELPPNRKIADLSKGMRSKLMLLLGISHGAELLILDEPTDGLDAVAVEDMLRELVSISSTEGTTIFFSSHQLEEVEQIADRVCIIDRGAAIVTGVLDDLKGAYQRLRIVFDQEPSVAIRWHESAVRVRQKGRTVEILASGSLDALLNQVRAWSGASIERFPVTLKELFLELAKGA